ncbi:MAG TPA: thioredoxin domain-containing protein [Candidatus Acidoferrales bacterium]|nr:thioredoxin domain-containing protein [Candidatus Acidoferrales bacterium]
MLRRIVIIIAAVAFTVAAQQPPSSSSSADQQLLNKVESYLRTLFAWDSSYQIKLGPLGPSKIPDTFEVPVKVTDGKGQSETGAVYVTRDGRYMFRGEIRDLNADPFAANVAKLHIEGFPSNGPADAKVTAVEFSDFECPHCREMFEILKSVEPEFPQVRFVFKDFPLTTIHPWAMTAALAARCAFESSPAAFWKLQDAIFTNQGAITADNAWDQITAYATAAGVSPDSLHACMAGPGAKKVIDDEIAEGKSLPVESTPTFFINGRPAINADKQALETLLRYELARSAPRANP